MYVQGEIRWCMPPGNGGVISFYMRRRGFWKEMEGMGRAIERENVETGRMVNEAV